MNTPLSILGRRIALIVFVSLISIISLAQSKTVTGKVVHQQTNEPMQGVTVNVKGTVKNTSTGADGSFTISVPNNQAILVFSYVGFASQEVSAAKSGSLSIAMVPGAAKLDEIVVVGFGTQKKRDVTGAIVSIKSEDIVARPGPNPMESLQGKVAGLDITRSSGQPGAGVDIQLRGTRSITASGTPLFIINGLPGDYATLNPYDIESIEVLKDASSTAVYGSAGANGIIIITTKSAKAGKLAIDFNSYYGKNGWSITPKMRVGDDLLKTTRDAYSYVWDATANKWTTTGAIWQSPDDDSKIFNATRYAALQKGDYANWPDLLMSNNAATQNYSLSVSGGNEKTKGYISFNYTDEKGQYTGDNYKLYSTSMRVDHKVKQWLSIGTNLQTSYVDRNKAQEKLETALVNDPLALPYNADGTLNTTLGNNVYNLLLNAQPGVYANVDNNLKLFVNPYVEIKPLKGLTFLSRASAQLDYSNTYSFDGIGSVNYTYKNAGIARAKITQNRHQGYKWENVLTYNFKLAGHHDFTVTGASSWYYDQYPNTEMNQSNIVSNNFKWYNFTGDVNTTAISSYSMTKTFALIGRVNYSYMGKYLFSASLRHDGSSVLYPTNRWDNFPAVSAGWRISEEKFMEPTRDWLTNLKLRVGWGITGTANILPYTSVAVLESANMSLGGVVQPIYRNSSSLTNPALSWEKSHNINFGLDAGFLKDRINLSVDYYLTKTDGVIYTVISPAIYGTYKPGSGAGTQYSTNVNIAQTQNRGLELALNTRNIVTRNFEWTTALTYSHYKDQILALTGGANNNIPNGTTPYTLTIGQPVNSFRNYKLDGVWQIGQEADAAVFGCRPGDLNVDVPGMTKLAEGVYSKAATDGTTKYYYTDLAAAQKINPDLTAATSKYTYSQNDFQTLGHAGPNWTLGFQNGFKYKNFDLSVYAFFRWGQMINYNMLGWYQPNGFAINASPSRTIPTYFNYWTPTNPSNDFPRMDYQSSSSTMLGSSGLPYVDGSFFKIKNITLGYTLPANVSKRIAIQRLRVYGTVTNPVVVAKSHLIKQYDPEMNGSMSYPLTKQIVAGLNVTF